MTVDAHAGWPVKVEAKDELHSSTGFTGKHEITELGVVQPGEVQEFYCHSTRQLVITEQQKDEG